MKGFVVRKYKPLYQPHALHPLVHLFVGSVQQSGVVSMQVATKVIITCALGISTTFFIMQPSRTIIYHRKNTNLPLFSKMIYFSISIAVSHEAMPIGSLISSEKQMLCRQGNCATVRCTKNDIISTKIAVFR
jgi:hypothetical protein